MDGCKQCLAFVLARAQVGDIEQIVAKQITRKQFRRRCVRQSDRSGRSFTLAGLFMFCQAVCMRQYRVFV